MVSLEALLLKRVSFLSQLGADSAFTEGLWTDEEKAAGPKLAALLQEKGL